MPLMGRPSTLQGGGRPASAASGAPSPARNSSSPAVLMPASARVTCPRKPRATSPAAKDAMVVRPSSGTPVALTSMRPGPAPPDVPLGQEQPSHLGAIGGINRGSNIRTSGTPSSGAAVEAGVDLDCRAVGLAVQHQIGRRRRCARRMPSIRRAATGPSSAPRASAGRNAAGTPSKFDERRDGRQRHRP